MKTSFRFAASAFALSVLSAASVSAATLPVQGALRTLAGGPVADGKYTMTLSLYQNQFDVKSVWNEIHVAVPVSLSLFTFELGAIDGDKNPLPVALFGDGLITGPWLGVKVEDEAELPRVLFHAVPYAWFAGKAKVADTLSGPLSVDLIAAGSVAADKVAFNYAGSAAKGGAATTALLAEVATLAKVADFAKNADNAAAADEAKSAKNLQCSGCVTVAMLADAVTGDLVKAGKLATVAQSGKYADLQGGPDLTPFARLDKPQAFAGLQTWSAGGALGGDVDFAKHQANLFRVQNAAVAPAACDAAMAGGIYFDTKQKRFFGCNGANWLAISTGINSQDNAALSCKALLDSGEGKVSGLYWLKPAKALVAKQIWCDQVTAGGGWALVFHVYDHTGMSENKFIAATGDNKFTDVDWNLVGGKIVNGVAANSPQPGKVTGAVGIGFFDGGWNDLRASCAQKTGDLAETAFAQIDGYAAANGNWKLLGSAANGKSYLVDKTKNSQGNTTIWVDNELTTENGGHYLCDTYNAGANGTSQFSLCYTDFLNNDNNADMGDSIVAIGFGTIKGDDSWSAGFTGECGPMGGNALLDVGTFSYWVR